MLFSSAHSKRLYFFFIYNIVGLQKEGHRFVSWVGVFLCGAFLPPSSHSPKTWKLVLGLISYSKLPVGPVNLSVNGCLTRDVGPAMNWQHVQSVPDFA